MCLRTDPIPEPPNVKLVILAACLCLFAIPGLAVSSDEQNTNRLWLGQSLLGFQYKEYSGQNELLDREDGLMPGLRIGGDFQRRSLLLSIDFTYHAGTVNYDGQTQTGAPHKTLTRETISEITASIGKRFGERGLLYLGGGYRQWDRDIQPNGKVFGLFERYTWPYAMLGGELRIWHTNRHRIGLNGRVTYPLNPEMTLRLNGYGDIHLRLGMHPGFRLTAPWLIQLPSRHQLQIAPYYEYWQMGRSPGVIVGKYIFHEPRSETGNMGITVSISL